MKRLGGIPVLAMIALCAASPDIRAALYPGYVLYGQFPGQVSYLIDTNGTPVHTWTHPANGGFSLHLTAQGTLLRSEQSPTPQGFTGIGWAGTIQELDKDGVAVWSFTYLDLTHVLHHDIELMPNGHVLAIGWEVKSAVEVETAGFSVIREVWPDLVIEVAPPSGTLPARIVWEWHSWDHLVPSAQASAHPELINMDLVSANGNSGLAGGDFMHLNGISYNAERDQIAITSRFFGEVYIIDHSTTTVEATGHTGGRSGKGGDLLYRWGHPSNFGAAGEVSLRAPHCPNWIPPGYPGADNLLVFNNGVPTGASSAIELVLPFSESDGYVPGPDGAYGPTSPVWTYSNGSEFYTIDMGGCQRLSNGNTLLCESSDKGKLREVQADGTVAWHYTPGFQVSKARKYSPDHPGIVRLLGTSGSMPQLPGRRTERGGSESGRSTVVSAILSTIDGRKIPPSATTSGLTRPALVTTGSTVRIVFPLRPR